MKWPVLSWYEGLKECRKKNIIILPLIFLKEKAGYDKGCEGLKYNEVETVRLSFSLSAVFKGKLWHILRSAATLENVLS